MMCKYCCHYDGCKIREEYKHLNSLYRKTMETYRPDDNKPKVTDIPYIGIPDLVCKKYRVDRWTDFRKED